MDIEKLAAGLSKEAYGSDVEDLLLEAAGYAACGGEIATNKERQNDR